MDYLETNALVANIASLVMLGILGVTLRAILGAVGDIGVAKAELKVAQSDYDQRKIIAKMILINGRLYKNAILASSLPSDGKIKVVEDFEALQRKFREFKALELAVEPEIEANVEGEGLVAGVLDTVEIGRASCRERV